MRTSRPDCMQEIQAWFGEHSSHRFDADKVHAGSFGYVPSGLERFQRILKLSKPFLNRHSSVCRRSFVWQHRSLSGRAVLHLEVELKPF